jgi:hypothetical protein
MSSPSITQEEAMGKAVPNTHPAVVLRSHYQAIRSLLAIAMIAVVVLTATVVVLATDDDTTGGSIAARTPAANPSFESRPDEGTVASAISKPAPPVARPDESKVAASIALHERRADSEPVFRRQLPQGTTARPDESTVAGAISGR